jgi:hypothetical protein
LIAVCNHSLFPGILSRPGLLLKDSIDPGLAFESQAGFMPSKARASEQLEREALSSYLLNGLFAQRFNDRSQSKGGNFSRVLSVFDDSGLQLLSLIDLDE